ncbi:hypothetical protein CRG98_006739 [Punica granatum]|uniref:Uncharacterized protein n=1 Tax=Punica granatum TaxID=22663 RepID=A0A2I0KWN1_PUNGR|nr:hypothetical protein CRG98_006739 [Punica granatum]
MPHNHTEREQCFKLSLGSHIDTPNDFRVTEQAYPSSERTIRVDPINLGAKNHHGHLEGSLGYPGPLTLPQNSIGIHRGEFRPENCPVGPISRTHSLSGDLCRTIRVDPINLGAKNHHGHLEGSLGYPGPLTLPQNSIGSLRGDVRLDLCQSGLSRLFGSIQRKIAQTRPTKGPTQLFTVPSRIPGLVTLSGPFGFRGYFGHFDQIILDLPGLVLVAVS